MKKKIIPDDNISDTLKELTLKASKIINQLENEKDRKNSINIYQELIKLNSIIERKFYTKSKEITQNIKEKINNINKKKNAK